MKADIIIRCHSDNDSAPILDSLSKADFADETRLFVCGNIAQRALDKYASFFAAVNTDNPSTDIIDFISSHLDSQRRVIVMDSQAEVSSFVLKYLNSALDFYDNRGVAFISGYSPELEIPLDFHFSTYAMHRPDFLVFATWSNVWKKFDLSSDAIFRLFSDSRQLSEFKAACPDIAMSIIEAKKNGSTVDVNSRLAVAACLASCPTIYPRRSLARSANNSHGGIQPPLSANVSLSHFSSGIAQEQDLVSQFYDNYKIGTFASLKSWFLSLHKNRFK